MSLRNGLVGLGVVGASIALNVGCGGAAKTPTQTASQASASARCARRTPGVGAVRADDARQGSPVALATLGDRTLAYVADEDDNVLHTVDLSTGRELGSTALAGTPSQVLIAKDGRVLVSLRDRNQVTVLEPTAASDRPLATLCSIDVAAEPVAMAATPDDSTVLVTSGWGRTMTALDGDTLKSRYRVALAREPRAVVVSDDGSRAFVAHVVGSRVSSIDLRAPEHPVRTVDMTGQDPTIQRRSAGVMGLVKRGVKGQERLGCQSFALAKSVEPPGRIFAPQVLVDPGDTEQATGGYGDGFRPAEVASIGVIDEGTGEPIEASLKLTGNEAQRHRNNNGMVGTRECLLPRAAATDARRKSLFVTCLGIDAVVEYDATAADPRSVEKARWSVGAGPTGVAVDRAGQRLVVWSQFDQSLSVIALSDSGEKRPSILALSRKGRSAAEGDVALGRKLFHMTGDPRISSDGRACASCHPDGRDDSLTWATPDGPRNTPMLAGRVAHTAPYGWNGSSDSVEGHLHQTLQRLQGRGLEANEVAALDSYLGAMTTPVVYVPKAGPEADRVAKGKALFESAGTACSTCHKAEGAFADAAGHDIGSKARADREGNFDTPSLRFVSGTAPYFHDGRYRTMRELLVGADGKMGHTKNLSTDDLDALESYMKSLLPTKRRRAGGRGGGSKSWPGGGRFGTLRRTWIRWMRARVKGCRGVKCASSMARR
jgi:cytochrome c peroxidase